MRCDFCDSHIEIDIKNKENYRAITCCMCAGIACSACYNERERLCKYCVSCHKYEVLIK